MKILHVVGARPNFMKMAPLIDALARSSPSLSQVVVHTGQHYDPEMSQIFIDELGLPEPDYSLAAGSGGHSAQTARILERIEPILDQERPDAVVVAGDVNSTLAGALAAVKIGIPVAHVEAGLRSFDRSMPEEINRLLTDQVSRWCFTHSPEAEANLLREGVDPDRIHFVGNTMIDTLIRLRPLADRSGIHERLGLERNRYVLVTLHRPKLVDGPLLEQTLVALAELGREFPVVFPVHPRTRARIGAFRDEGFLHLLHPLGYLDFLALEAWATAVVTDSGGIQEETTFLRIPCFTLREQTERPITVTRGTNRLLGLDVERIVDVPRMVQQSTLTADAPDGWDGNAGVRAAGILLRDLAATSGAAQAATSET